VPKIYGFIHCYAVNNWRWILREQIRLIQNSQLSRITAQVVVTIVDPKSRLRHLQITLPSNFTVNVIQAKECSPLELELGEGLTLKQLHSRAGQEDCLVWYIQGKGVTWYYHQWYPDIANWRYLCEYFTLTQYQACVDALQSGQYDACGPLWNPNASWPHFSGNFWWADSRYIAQLPDIVSYSEHFVRQFKNRRLAAEAWVGSSEVLRAKSMYDFDAAYAHPFLYEIDISEKLLSLNVRPYKSRLSGWLNLGRKALSQLRGYNFGRRTMK